MTRFIQVAGPGFFSVKSSAAFFHDETEFYFYNILLINFPAAIVLS